MLTPAASSKLAAGVAQIVEPYTEETVVRQCELKMLCDVVRLEAGAHFIDTDVIKILLVVSTLAQDFVFSLAYLEVEKDVVELINER